MTFPILIIQKLAWEVFDYKQGGNHFLPGTQQDLTQIHIYKGDLYIFLHIKETKKNQSDLSVLQYTNNNKCC